MNTSSNNGSAHERLIRDLVTDLIPVRRLRPPSVRALAWLAVVAAIAITLALMADLPALGHRLIAAPDMWLAVVVPPQPRSLPLSPHSSSACRMRAERGRCCHCRRRYCGSSRVGSAAYAAWFVPGTHAADLSEARDCLIFIVALSVPLSALLIIMLRRACPLYPRLTALIAGLASAAAAATLLNFFHPFDAAATDLAVHIFAVALVIVANRTFSGRLLATNFSRSSVTRAVAGSN